MQHDTAVENFKIVSTIYSYDLVLKCKRLFLMLLIDFSGGWLAFLPSDGFCW